MLVRLHLYTVFIDVIVSCKQYQVRHAAFQLALATQSMAEDEEYALVGQDLADVDSTGKSGDEAMQIACTNPACGVRHVPLHLNSIQNAETSPDQSTKLHQCSDCGELACAACVARPGPSGNFSIPSKEAVILCKRYSRTLISLRIKSMCDFSNKLPRKYCKY